MHDVGTVMFAIIDVNIVDARWLRQQVSPATVDMSEFLALGDACTRMMESGSVPYDINHLVLDDHGGRANVNVTRVVEFQTYHPNNDINTILSLFDCDRCTYIPVHLCSWMFQHKHKKSVR